MAVRDGNPRDYSAAMRRADAAVEAAPDDPELRRHRGRMQFDRRYYGKAIDDYSRVAELLPSDRDARRMVAFSHHHLRQPKQERKAWEALLVVAPDDPDAHYFLGSVLLRSSDKTDVVLGEQHLKVAIEKSPKHRLALQALAYLEWGRGNHALAEDYLKRALVLSDPNTADAAGASPAETIAGEASILFSLGAVQQSAGRNPDAVQSYEQCLVFDPAHARASANLGQILLDLGDPDQGLRRLRDALELEEDKKVQALIEAVIEAAEARLAAEGVTTPPAGPFVPAPIPPAPASGGG
jgi:tetratricopeptide (TPR) repeat protein